MWEAVAKEQGVGLMGLWPDPVGLLLSSYPARTDHFFQGHLNYL